jgi:DNA invertase Pin-like site-specific DNA recombinase
MGRERQFEGIAKAKAAGVYKGRKPTRKAGRNCSERQVARSTIDP